MNNTLPSARPTPWIADNWRSVVAWTAVSVVLGAALGPDLLAHADTFRFNPHWPDAAVWARVPFKVQLHALSAMTALGIGFVLLRKPKGTGLHRTLGWTWAATMAVTAGSGLFLTGLRDGWSLIHLLSGWTIVALPMALAAIRGRNVRLHRGLMTGLFGGLIVAGVLVFLPGRLMWRLFFG